MLLSAVCKKAGYQVGLVLLKKNDLIDRVKTFKPDVVAYSAIGRDARDFKKADVELCTFLKTSGRKVFRIMGGPHPTYNPEVLEEFHLDAICQRDGEHALITLLDRLAQNESLECIPNIGLTKYGAQIKEKLRSDALNELPYADRSICYNTVSYAQETGFRSFITSRGCIYRCTHCYNQKNNDIFSGCGPIVRRRSVSNVLDEIEFVIKYFPPVRFIRFFDDVFCFRNDPWLEEFSREYSARINIPFYCLVRPNSFDEEQAILLRRANCYSCGQMFRLFHKMDIQVNFLRLTLLRKCNAKLLIMNHTRQIRI